MLATRCRTAASLNSELRLLRVAKYRMARLRQHDTSVSKFPTPAWEWTTASKAVFLSRFSPQKKSAREPGWASPWFTVLLKTITVLLTSKARPNTELLLGCICQSHL